MPALIDLTGQRFGALTVLHRDGSEPHGNLRRWPVWRCECDCGYRVRVRGDSLRRGRTRSCGCRRGEPSMSLRRRLGPAFVEIFGDHRDPKPWGPVQRRAVRALTALASRRA